MKAVLVGAVVDIACTYGSGFATALTIGIVWGFRHVPHDQWASYSTRPTMLIWGLLIGNGSALLGGFVAGRMATTGELVHAALAILPCMTLGAILHFVVRVTTPVPTWYTIAAFGLVLPFGIAGGYLGRQRKQTLAAIRAARSAAVAVP